MRRFLANLFQRHTFCNPCGGLDGRILRNSVLRGIILNDVIIKSLREITVES